ncbi:MAG: HNH endonuclease [Bacteroidetes bacterium]|nr:HNH endonuclease [Bacteroidota bacterium]MBS1629398.1 HNH endonuclease [Bacteroidota bacterium]
MPKLNRDSSEDAKRAVERLLPDPNKRQKFINLLCDGISYADSLDSANWNLNLETSGKFLRFNTGQEYCIQLNKGKLLLLCDRTTLRLIPDIIRFPVEYVGWNGERSVYNQHFDQVPDALARTNNSVGCWFDTTEDFTVYVDKFRSSNKDFIRAAMNTTLTPLMRRAHSKGAVEYVFSAFNENSEQDLPELTDVLVAEAEQLDKALRLSRQQRLDELKRIDPKPKQVIVQQTVFLRNQLVVAEVLYRANGHCEQCQQPAPFLRDSDNTPYLEVHHKTRLADGGDDTVENAIALCPNCHRQVHHGQKRHTITKVPLRPKDEQ